MIQVSLYMLGKENRIPLSGEDFTYGTLAGIRTEILGYMKHKEVQIIGPRVIDFGRVIYAYVSEREPMTGKVIPKL